MMSEGTKTRDGEALSNALQLLGTNVSVGDRRRERVDRLSCRRRRSSRRRSTSSPTCCSTRRFPPTRSSGCAAQRLVALTQAKAQPARSPAACFRGCSTARRIRTGSTRPRSRIKAITRDDVVAFHKAYFQPGRALVTVVGDVDAGGGEGRRSSKALAGWPKGGDEADVHVSGAAGAAADDDLSSSTSRARRSRPSPSAIPGPPRSTPDYYALQVMNTILGGMFQSRLNANIREEKGYSYGVNSSFAYGKGPGAFRAGGDIVSAKTDAALVEFMKELRGHRRRRPDHRRGADDGEGLADPAAARHVRVGAGHQRRDHDALDAGPAGRLLPAVREARRRDHEGRRAARREAVHRSRSSRDRHRRRRPASKGRSRRPASRRSSTSTSTGM